LELREWQQNAIDYFFSHDKKAIFSVPTGSGKTFVAIKILKKVLKYSDPKIRILIVVPKNVILKGWVQELRDQGFLFDKVGIYNGECKEYSKITLTTTASISKLNYKMFEFLIADEVHNMGTPRQLEILKHN